MDNAFRIRQLEEENEILKSQCEFWEKLYRKDTNDLIKQRDELKAELDKHQKPQVESENIRHV